MATITDLLFDFCIMVLLFILVGGVSHRNGGTCEQRHPDHSAYAGPRSIAPQGAYGRSR